MRVTKRQLRRIIKEEKRRLVRGSRRRLELRRILREVDEELAAKHAAAGEEGEEGAEDEEAMAAKGDFKAWLIDLAKSVSQMKVSAKELEPLKAQIETLITAAETKDLSGSVGDRITTQITKLGGVK